MPSISLAKPGLNISLHPSARAAYEWLENYPRLIDWSALPFTFTNALLTQHIQGVMQYKKGTEKEGRTGRRIPIAFQFYAPLWPARYWPNGQPPTGTVLIHDDESINISSEEIEKAAWLSVLQLLVFSVNANEIATLRDSLQKWLPEPLSYSLFGKMRMSDNELCLWTGLSRGTLVQQRKRLRPTTESEESVSPLAILARPWNPDDETAPAR